MYKSTSESLCISSQQSIDGILLYHMHRVMCRMAPKSYFCYNTYYAHLNPTPSAASMCRISIVSSISCFLQFVSSYLIARYSVARCSLCLSGIYCYTISMPFNINVRLNLCIRQNIVSESNRWWGESSFLLRFWLRYHKHHRIVAFMSRSWIISRLFLETYFTDVGRFPLFIQFMIILFPLYFW